MLTTPTQLTAYVDALRVLIRDGKIERAEDIIEMVLNREPALKGKTDVLNVLREGIEPVASGESQGHANTILDFIAKMHREYQWPRL